MTVPTLHTERLRLGPIGLEHFEPIATFYKSERSRHVGGPITREQAWRSLASEAGHWALRGYGRFAVELRDTGTMVGLVGPWYPEAWPEPELGWDLMNGHEGKGYATEAALGARDWCYSTLGWTTAISMIAVDNAGSANVAKRVGATMESEMTHPRFGEMYIFRHPRPEGRA